jgi:hypothetical protein
VRRMCGVSVRQELLQRIVELSYRGDIRLLLRAEDPHKVRCLRPEDTRAAVAA